MAIGLFVAGRDSARADRFVTASKVHPIKVGFYFSFCLFYLLSIPACAGNPLRYPLSTGPVREGVCYFPF
jgi:hypothetical protein